MDAVAIISQLGVPVGVMVVMGYAVWQAFKWIAPKVDKAIDGTMLFQQRVADSSEKSADALDQMIPIIETNQRLLEKLAEGHHEHNSKIDRIREKLDEIFKDIQIEKQRSKEQKGSRP